MRSMLVLRLKDATEELAKDIVSNATRHAGVLFVLPQNVGAAFTEEDSARIQSAERVLVTSKVNLPVYFAYETDSIQQMVSALEEQAARGVMASAQTGGYKLIVNGRNSPIRNPQLSNLVGWLPGAGRPEPSRNHHPVIAISAHYDTFASAPGLAYGSNNSGSGVVVLLQLARMFSQLYSRLSARPNFSLVFVLTSGGPLDFSGTKSFLQASDPGLLNNIDFALCLDSLANWQRSGALRLFHSRPAAEESVGRWYDAFAAAAKRHGVAFESVHRKVQLKEPYNSHEHEVWAKRRILAATLSDREASAPPPAYDGSVLDRRTASRDALAPVVQTVFDAIVSVIVAADAADVDVRVQPKFMDRWLENLANVPRMAAMTTQSSKIFAALQKVLEDMVSVSVQHYTLTSSSINPVFYSASKMQGSIVNVASIWFEAGLGAAVALWCSVLYVAVTLSTRGWVALSQDLRLTSKVPSKKR